MKKKTIKNRCCAHNNQWVIQTCSEEERGGFVLVALPAFLPSVISPF